MKSKLNQFLFWAFNKLFKRFRDYFLTNILTYIPEKELFEIVKTHVKQKQFVREIHEIDVKKGKRKYTLVIVQTIDGQKVFNLGRHRETVEA
jgi:hypothetical protein